MAKVTQEIAESNAPDYLNLSRGTDKARAISNTSMGELFKDIGNIIPAATKAAYEGINQKIRTGLQDQIDHVRTAFGVDAAVEQAALDKPITDTKGDVGNSLFDPAFKSGRGTPMGVARLGNTMSSLNSAYQQGKLSETYYNARLMQIVKEAKAANPGFNDEIDQHIQSITGINPANALRKSLQNDLDMAERARQAAMSKDDSFIQQNAEYLTKETAEKFIKGDRSPQTLAQAKWEIYGKTARKAEIDAQLKDLELTNKSDAHFQTKATRVAGVAVNSYLDDVLFKAIDGTAGSEGILNKIKMHDTTKPYTPQELEEVRTAWRDSNTKTLLGVDAVLARPEFSGMDQSAKKAIRDAAAARLGVIENAIVNKDYGILVSNENYVKGMQNADTRKILESSDYIRKQSAVLSLPGGKEYWSVMMMKDPNLFGKGIKALSDLEALDLGSGSRSLTQILDDRMATARKLASEGSPEAYTKTITDAARGLVAAPVGPMTDNYVKSLFGPQNAGFWGKIDNASKPRVYGILTSPEVTKKMAEIAKTQPEAYKTYMEFATTGFDNLMKTKLQDISAESRDANSAFKIDFNPKTNQFEIGMAPGKEGLRTSPSHMAEKSALERKIVDVNRGLTTLAPILKAGDADVAKSLLTTFEVNGWKNGAKDPTLLQRMGDAIKSVFIKEEAPGQGPIGGSYAFNGLEGTKAVKSDYMPSQGEKISLEGNPIGTGAKGEAVKAVIRQAEASGDYNAVFGSKNKIPLTQMTLNDVMSLQEQMRSAGSPSTAVGGYQFLNRTLKDLKTQLKLSGNETFDETLQEKLADALLHKRGFGLYLDGKIGHKELVDRLAMEWAGLPNTKGKSHYDGDGLNRSTVKLRTVLDALKAIDS